MELTEIQLRKLVERVMELTLELTADKPKEKILVVLSGDEVERFSTALQALKVDDKYETTVVVTKEQMDIEEVGKTVCEYANKIATWEEILKSRLDYKKILFPSMPREILAKCALCIPDTYETKLIQRAFEKGIQVTIAKKGLDKFIGNEPAGYQQQILKYIRTLLEFGIEIELDLDTEKR